MKAQMVKNAVIVPTGAKGGFVVKRPPARPGGAARRGRRVLSGVHPRAARPHRQPRRRCRRPPARHRRPRRRRPLSRRRRRQGHGDVQRHRQRDRHRVRLLARRRLRLRRQRRLRPQGDGHHRPRSLGERAPPRQRAREGRRSRPAHRRRHRRHVRRRVRQRDAALAALCASSPPSTTATSSSIPTPIRRSPSTSVSGCSTCRARRGPTTTPRSISPGGGVYPRTLKSIELSPQRPRGARRARPSADTERARFGRC